MVKNFIPERGDIIFLGFNPQQGKEQAGRRPAIVLSAGQYNAKVGLVICCPITKQMKGYPFEVVLPGSLKTKGVILVDQIKSMDFRARGVIFIEKMPLQTLGEVLRKLGILLMTNMIQQPMHNEWNSK